MKNGSCRLCDNERDLHKSHIFPRGLYKRFIADQSKGGRFLNLRDEKINNSQRVRYWFCSDCEARLQRGEDAYYRLIDTKPLPDEHVYEQWLHYFAVSMSWRGALFYFQDQPGIEWMETPIGVWKSYLLNPDSNPSPYDQYLVSIASAEWKPWNQSLGSFAKPNLHLTFVMVGPMVVIGIAHPNEFDERDLLPLAAAKLSPSGGRLSLENTPADSMEYVPHVKTALGFFRDASRLKIEQIVDRRPSDFKDVLGSGEEVGTS